MGEQISPDVARYLSRHPDQRAEVEDLLFVAQRVSNVPSADLSSRARVRMQGRLADKLGFDPSALDAPAVGSPTHVELDRRPKRPVLAGRLFLARLRYAPPAASPDDLSEVRIRSAFRELTTDDIRRYIGVRGEDYLYYRQRLPGWEPVFALMAFVLRGFKRLEKLVAVAIEQ
ncbi:MAG: hypothetical protein M3014_03690 [Chloroflexota bacterium]|nr:hypothetical protein [Chloroflexota bacterium]